MRVIFHDLAIFERARSPSSALQIKYDGFRCPWRENST
jgi:hypothetical protein